MIGPLSESRPTREHTQQQIARALGVGRATISDWLAEASNHGGTAMLASSPPTKEQLLDRHPTRASKQA